MGISSAIGVSKSTWITPFFQTRRIWRVAD